MNQAILFSPQASWNNEREMVEFHAQQSGMLIECFISINKLKQLSSEPVINEDSAVVVFESLRFDIEELAEELIEDEEFSQDGKVIID
ncbi:DUF1488 family protein [Vibrio hippocampi]|uniref:Transcriptional regulator n=1 Tax=Vibrio hippocampi TaxID=654686 RepID=A0ABN8DBM2_9VIBR|nr:DUF1488 family protein [Vibrio hippocampi]CAH0524239.1 hypothetical protein VHP8226_00041 [Vibrio hippocampi]